MLDDAAEFFLFLPLDQNLGDTVDVCRRDEVLGVALFENPAGIHEECFALPGFWLGLVEEEHDARGGGIVEKVFGQVEDVLDEVLVHKPLADAFLLIGACVARAAGGGAGIEDDGGPTGLMMVRSWLETGAHVLDPTPVGGGFTGKTREETLEFVVVVIGLAVFPLVPHGIGDDAIEGAELAVFPGAELGILEGVADLDLSLHIVDDHVHIGHGPGLGDVFLAEQSEWRVFRLPGGLHFGLHGEIALDEEAAGAAGGVVNLHTRVGREDAGHDLADFSEGVELAGALSATFGELADEVFVALADDIGLNVLEPQSLGADGLDQVGEAVVVEVAQAVGGSVEVNTVDDALQGLVFPGDGPHVGSHAFADLVRELANDRPDRLFGIFRHEGKIEADELVVGLDELEGHLPRADLCGNAIHFVVEDVAETLGEDERENIVLVFRRILGPADRAGGIPYPGFERFVFGTIFSHAGVFQSHWNLSPPLGFRYFAPTVRN